MYIHSGAAKMWNRCIEFYITKSVQAGHSSCRNWLFCNPTFSICRQRGLLWSDNGVDGPGHVPLLYFCVKLLQQGGQVGRELRGVLNVFQRVFFFSLRLLQTARIETGTNSRILPQDGWTNHVRESAIHLFCIVLMFLNTSVRVLLKYRRKNNIMGHMPH